MGEGRLVGNKVAYEGLHAIGLLAQKNIDFADFCVAGHQHD